MLIVLIKQRDFDPNLLIRSILAFAISVISENKVSPMAIDMAANMFAHLHTHSPILPWYLIVYVMTYIYKFKYR